MIRNLGRKTCCVLGILLLLAIPAMGQTLTLPATLTVAQNGQADVTATSDCTDIKWFVPENPGLVVMEYGKHGGKITDITVIGLQPGTYRIKAIGALNGKLSPVAVCTVTVPGAPTPPTPGPGPTPTPTASKLWIVTLDDATKRTPGAMTVLGAESFWASLSAKGDKFSKLDITDPKAQAFSKYSSTTPAMVVMNQTDGTVLWSGPLPATVDALSTLLGTLQK